MNLTLAHFALIFSAIHNEIKYMKNLVENCIR